MVVDGFVDASFTADTWNINVDPSGDGARLVFSGQDGELKSISI